MYLFILESIGTSELILIGIVALIVFGPRKLPQMARTVGRMMTEFRTATNDFKTTWQREASFEEESNQIKNIFNETDPEETPIHRKDPPEEIEKGSFIPEIREVDASLIKAKLQKEEEDKTEKIKQSNTDKRDWL